MLDFNSIPYDVPIRLGFAAICGVIIGFERELKHKNAGLRTFLLVSIGSCAFTLLIEETVKYYAENFQTVRIDPARVVEGIITGIGFLGGGVILHSKDRVTGTASGAGIWVAGAIGIACGFGFYWHAIFITLAVLIVLIIMGKIRSSMRPDLGVDLKD